LGDGERHVWLPMRRSDIANYLGLTLETLSRLFADFMARDLISRQSVRHIAIRDRAALARMAGSA
jgi:CRP-like cAMP-binding protein